MSTDTKGDHFIGIDVGTSAVKAVLVDSAQEIVAEVEVPLVTSRPQPGWSEQHPDLWWQAVERVLASFHGRQAALVARVGAIGLSGQMHGAVMLDSALTPLRPAILWNDSRSGAEAEALARLFPDLARETGVMPMSGLTAPKLDWLAHHEPDLRAKLAMLMLPKDYVRLKLTGTCITDMSDAAGTWLLDEARRAWSPAALAALKIRESQLPRLVEGNAAASIILPALAARFGLAEGVIVAGGAGDAAAGAVGIGAIKDGDAFLSLGTSGQLFVTTSAFRPAPDLMVHAFCHALPGRWLQMGAMLSAASSLAFATDLFQCEVTVLLAEAEAAAPAGPLLFLPYLTGERTPHNDPDARGVLFGLTPATSRGEVVRAIMEGVAFSFADARDCLAQSGTYITEAGVIGGGARSPLWLQILSDVLDLPLVRYDASARGPAFGAARLARLALTHEAPETVCTAPKISGRVTPHPREVEAYARRLPHFRGLYQALKSQFPHLQHQD